MKRFNDGGSTRVCTSWVSLLWPLFFPSNQHLMTIKLEGSRTCSFRVGYIWWFSPSPQRLCMHVQNICIRSPHDLPRAVLCGTDPIQKPSGPQELTTTNLSLKSCKTYCVWRFWIIVSTYMIFKHVINTSCLNRTKPTQKTFNNSINKDCLKSLFFQGLFCFFRF